MEWVLMKLADKLLEIQASLKVPKTKNNLHGNYKYRDGESILKELKPSLVKHKLSLKLIDEMVNIGNRYYLKATCILSDDSDSTEAYGFAREDEKQPGMVGSQLTGSCSSYARKYALNAMLLIDDSIDPDSDSFANKIKKGQEDKEKEIASQLATFKGVIDKGFITEPDTHDIEDLKAELKAVVWLSKTNHVQIGKYFTDSLKAYEQTLKETEVPK